MACIIELEMSAGEGPGQFITRVMVLLQVVNRPLSFSSMWRACCGIGPRWR